MSSSPATPAFSLRWDKLIEACLGGRLMPFLGAGVSIYATLGGNDRASHYGNKMPATGILTARILDGIKSRPLPPAWAMTELARITGPKHKPNETPSFADAAQLFIDLHPQGEHGLYADGGPLDIRLFLSIQPTLAHRALAWLVRENLFSEVITTNYDCALENAFQESFGEASAAFNPIAHRPYRVICDHLNYRQHAATSQRLHEGAPTPVLRVYKINGCANHYHRHRVSGDAKETNEKLGPGFLVITDRHLQDFGRRQWAQDLFRDRFRSRKIVFSGFGAEEPQIRFTALRVIEEFAAQKNTGSEPHCFLQVFEGTLGVAQLQIAKASSSAVGCVPDPGPSVFTKRDLAEFSPFSADVGLSAALFWQKLHRDVATRLIERRLERCEFFSWLRERDHLRPLSHATAHGLRQRVMDTGTGAPSAWLAGFLSLDPSVEHTLRLMVLAWRARQLGDSRRSCPSGYYEELDRGDSLPLKLLYLFHLLAIEANAVTVVHEAFGFWLQLHRSTALDRPPTPPRWVFVTAHPPRLPPPPPDQSVRLATCLILCPSDTESETRRPSLQHRSVVSWYFITLPECLSKVACASFNRPLAECMKLSLLDSHDPCPRPSFYESTRLR